MKIIRNITLRFLMMLAVVLTSVSVFAQEGGGGADVNVDINKGGGDWYTQPWVWIVGGAIFILLLVVLLRSNSSKD